MRTLHQIIFAAATLALNAASADAKPRHVVVMDFEGPRLLADSGRAAVLNVLNEEYDIVSPKAWEEARMKNVGRGPMQWSAAAKASNVDAVVEGWVDPEGMRTHSLNLAVRDAATGRQIDTLRVKISDKGVVTAQQTREMSKSLDEILGWVAGDGGIDSGAGAHLPSVDQYQLRITEGTHKPQADAQDGDDDDDDDAEEAPAPKHHKKKHHHHPTHHVADEEDSAPAPTHRHFTGDQPTSDAATPAEPAKDITTAPEKTEDAPAPKKVAAATDAPAGVDNGTRDLINIFGPTSADTEVVLDRKAPTLVRPSPKIEVSAGLFVADRGMNFTQDPPDFAANPPAYPASGMYGMMFQVAVFPRPLSKYGNDLTGLGATFQLQKSVGAMLTAQDTVADTIGDYSLDYTAYEGAIHYRYPTGMLMLDGQVNYGRASYQLESDFPANVQIPDTSYEYLGIGGDIELAVTDRTRLGFGARYMYILNAGDVSDEEWYGSGTASGLELNANFKIPLTDMLYLKGMIEYRRVSMDFNGDGNLSTAETDSSLAVSNITDSSIGGNVQIGVSF